MFRLLLFSAILTVPVLVAAPQARPFRSPMIFEPNRGQAPPQVSWIARSPGYRVFLTSEGITITFRDHPARSPRDIVAPALFGLRQSVAAPSKPSNSTVRMKLTGSRAWDTVTGV